MADVVFYNPTVMCVISIYNVILDFFFLLLFPIKFTTLFEKMEFHDIINYAVFQSDSEIFNLVNAIIHTTYI